MQRRFSRLLKQRDADMGIDLRRLFEDVANTLVGGSKGWGLWQCSKGAHRCQPAADIAQLLRTQGQHGVDFLRAVAQLAQAARQPVIDEIQQGRRRIGDFVAEDTAGVLHQRVQIQWQCLVGQHTHHAQRMAAQRKRVLVAGRQVADAEHADQGFELIGQRHRQPDRAARQFVAGKARFVMVFNRVGNLGCQAVVERVVTAHDALQLRELAHHVGHQIGLGELGRLVSLRRQRSAAELLADGLGNRPHTRHALALRAELVVINHFVQACYTRGQCLFAVLVVEEFSVRQARTHHTLVATNHRTGVCRVDVADHQKLMGQLASGVKQGKVFLIGLHGQDQAFLRHREELFFKTADQHLGPLDQRSHFVEQRLVFNRLHTATDLVSSSS